MKNTLKKIMALGIAGAMMIGMSVSAFAATNGVTSDGKGEEGAATTNATSINIPKSVVVENPTASITVAYPAMEFTYTVAPKTPATDANVTDKDGDIAAVVVGVEDGITLGNGGKVSIPAGTIQLNTKGQEIVVGDLTVSVDLNKFTSPGIYRYAITDITADTALTGIGVVRDAALDKEFILDVYIKLDETTTPGTLGVGGYVLTREEVTHINGETDKDSGFDKVDIITTETPGTGDQPGTTTRKLNDSSKAEQTGNDFYYTYNATVAKKVSGAMGDKNNQFQFALTVTNKAGTQTIPYYVDARTTKGGNWTAATTNTFVENGEAAYLKDGEIATIYGLNPYATVNYTETNNTSSTYTVVKVFNGTDKANVATQVGSDYNKVAPNGNVNAFTQPQNVVTYAAAAKGTELAPINVKYENNLTEVSPTGVVLRFAPYVILLGAAIVLLMATRRRRAH